MLPTERGIAAYTSTQHVLSPYPFALDVSLPDPDVVARPYLVFPLDAGHLGMVTKLSHHDAMGTLIEELDYFTIDISAGKPSFSTKAPICSALNPDKVIDVVARAIDPTHEMVAITGDTEGCVLRVDAYVWCWRSSCPARPITSRSPRSSTRRARTCSPVRARSRPRAAIRRARSAPPPRRSRSSPGSWHPMT